MSLYNRGVAASNALVGPYRARATGMRDGALDFYRGGQRFYNRGIAVGGIKSGFINFIIDIAHIMLMVGGLYLLFTSIFA